MLKGCRTCKFGFKWDAGKIFCTLIGRHNQLTGEQVPTLHESTYGCRAWEKRLHKIRIYGTDGITASPKNQQIITKGVQNGEQNTG